MLTVEEKMKKKKKEDLFLLLIAYIIGLILAMQYYRAYLSLKFEKFTIIEVVEKMNYNIENNFMFIPTVDYKNTFIVVTIAFFVAALLIISNNKKYMFGKEHGSAKWGTLSEKRKFKDKDESNNTILTDEIKLSLNSRKTRKNLNTLILGGPGTGKTRGYVKPNLMQLNTSYVITDPKGEIFCETGSMFKKNGYKIKVFNIKNLQESMGYNPFKYIKKDEDIFKLIKCLIKNTDNGAKGNDPFWEKAETALLQAVMFYLYQEVEIEDQTLVGVMKMLRCIAVSEEDETLESPFDIIFKELEEEKGETMAVKQYKIFKAGAGKTAKSILISALSRLAFVDIPNLEKIFLKDELEIEMIGKEKTAFFIIIPDTDASFNFIVAMMYTQMFDILCQIADTERLKYQVRFILDEFANIGKIPDFEKVLTTIRSRGISASIILQSISQIKAQYKETWETIVDGCDTTLFLGGQATSKYISERLGQMTIDSRVYNYSRGRNSSSSENNSVLGRKIMTTDEIEQMPDDDCICLIRGCSPFYSKKFKIEKHKKYNELGNVDDIYDTKNFHFRDISNSTSNELVKKENVDFNTFKLPANKINKEIMREENFEEKVQSAFENDSNIVSKDLIKELNELFQNQNIEIKGVCDYDKKDEKQSEIKYER